MDFAVLVFVTTLVLIPVLVDSFQIDIDDLLNTNSNMLFPNITINHELSLAEDVLDRFNRLLEDGKTLTRAYHSFQRKYPDKVNQRGNKYNDSQRKRMFKENLMYIFKHNYLARTKLSSTFEMGVNPFADMHMDEFKSERLGLIISDDPVDIEDVPLSHFPNDTTGDSQHVRNIPSSFDWRDLGVISPIKNQKNCGACVMFGLTSVMEAHHAICNNKQILDLSEQFILDCAVRANGYRMNKGCDGNMYPDTLKFLLDHGLPSEKLYPYKGEQGKCTFDGMKPAVELEGFKKLRNRVEEVKYTVANVGPVAVGINVYEPFRFYKSGIYDQCDYAVAGHAMTITGFNDESPSVKYYIMKNQWSEEWGEKGYVRYTSTNSRCLLEKLAYSLQVKGCNSRMEQ